MNTPTDQRSWRKKHWPDDTAATEKLYDAREELLRTAAFIEKLDSPSERTRKKKKTVPCWSPL
jgi:hypothetical protein